MACVNHPDREAAGACSICGQGYCPECLIQLPDRLICANCKPAYLAGLGATQPVQTEGEGKSTACLVIGIGIGVFLLLLIFIGGILAAIAIPNFLKFQTKAKQSEAKSNLGAIYTAQVVYYAEYNTYAGKGILDEQQFNCFELIEWQPAGQNRYRYICDTADIQSEPTSTDCGIPKTIRSSKDGFTVCAAGNIDSDDFCDVWCINDAKVLKNMSNDGEEWLEDANDINN